MHYGSKKGEIKTLNYSLSHELRSEQSERASKQVSAAECASKASSALRLKTVHMGDSSIFALVLVLMAVTSSRRPNLGT